MSYNAEALEIATLVAAVQLDSENVFSAVWDFENPDFWNTLPCATVTPAPSGSAELAYGTVNNEATHIWHVRILYPWEATAASERAFRAALDATLTALRASSSVTLGGNVDYAVIGEQTFGYLSSNNDTPDVRTATISLRARSLLSRTPTA